MKQAKIFLIVLILIANLAAKSEILDSMATGGRLFSNSAFDSLLIPLKRAGNLLLIEVIIDGEYGNLIFDSGAAAELVLNQTYFRNHRKCGSKQITGINGLAERIDVITVDSLVMCEQTSSGIKADLLDLSHIENSKGIKVLGFFGLQLLNEFEIVLNIDKQELQLFRTDRKGNSNNPNTVVFDYSQRITISNNVLFLWAFVGGKELRFCLDTGAETNVISNTTPKKVLSTVSINGRIKVSDAGSRNNEMLFGTMNDFMLGTQKIDNMKTVITGLGSLSEIYGIRIDGVLGYEFLIQGKIFINRKKQNFGICFTK